MKKNLFCMFKHKEYKRRNREFDKYHSYFKYFWLYALIFNLCIIHVIFKFNGINIVSLVLGGFIIGKEIFKFCFLCRLEKRIIKPLDNLRTGVEEVVRGNYNVKIESNVNNEISLLMESFNKMTLKLLEGEILKNEYEENRKMLIANIAHDLKTPIASIQGYAEAIMDSVASSPEEISRCLKIIFNNTIYINNLIEDLFLFSQLDMDRLDFKYEKTYIALYMADLMEELKLEVEEKGYYFEYINQLEKDYVIKIDGKRIYQAIRNIVGNAIKYGAKGNLSIQTKLHRKNLFIYLEIKDNGSGIPKEKLPHIFNRFYRIDTERTKDLMSTGLGLAIAKELIEAHGGKISASNAENKGACFTIMFPITEE